MRERSNEVQAIIFERIFQVIAKVEVVIQDGEIH
jgi:hypothetical protein